jgi:hypothetical protein
MKNNLSHQEIETAAQLISLERFKAGVHSGFRFFWSIIFLVNILSQVAFSQKSGNIILDGNENAVPCSVENYQIELVTWVYLEGAMIIPSGIKAYAQPMRTSLNDLRVLPGQACINIMGDTVYTPAGQPYSGNPWYYNGNEGDLYDSYGDPTPGTANYPSTVVDWVLVSLRYAPDGETVCQKAALLHNDGHVEFVDGGFSCDELENYDSYYVVIEHRNHLIVMSDQSIEVLNGTITCDFRNDQSYIYDPLGFGGVGQIELLPELPGVYAMYSGNGCQGLCVISATDLNYDDRSYWECQNTTLGQYSNADYNLNGDCNYNDRIIWEFNNCIFTTVPRN